MKNIWFIAKKELQAYFSSPIAYVVPDGPMLCNGDDMRILHNAFLWGYEEAPGLAGARGAPAGDVARSEFLGQWLADLDATLHTHHESEDEPPVGQVEQRAPACALHVGQMRADDAQVAQLLEEASPLLARWRATADPTVGEQRPTPTSGWSVRRRCTCAVKWWRSFRSRSGWSRRKSGPRWPTKCRAIRRVDSCRSSGRCLRTRRRRTARLTRACPSP